MIQSEAAKFLPILKAWSEGKTIQWRNPANHFWYDVATGAVVQFDQSPSEYRIKPEPREYWLLFDENKQVRCVTEEPTKTGLIAGWYQVHVKEVIR